MNNMSEYKFSGVGLKRGEKIKAKQIFEDYKNHYHFENLSDLHLLEEVVYRETIQDRYKMQISDAFKKEEDQATIPIELLKVLDDNLNQILKLKEKLGLLEEKKSEDPFKYIQLLKKKFAIWREEHSGSRQFSCPHCSKIIMLKIRMEAWEAQKHPFFRDKVLCNDHLVRMFMDNKISKEDVSKIFGTSEDYIDWLIEKWYQNEKAIKKNIKE